MSRRPVDHSKKLRQELVRRHGWLKGLAKMFSLIGWNLLTTLRFGPARTHLVLSVAALLNGSAHCAYVHGYAYQLSYFRRRGTPFPLDDGELLALARGGDDALRARLDRAFEAAGLPLDAALVRRLCALKLGDERPRGFTDRCLAKSCELMDVANYSCIAESQPLEDLVLGRRGLKNRYAAARLALHAKPDAPPR